MKKMFFVLLVVLLSSYSFSQTKTDLVGIWKAYVKAGNKPTTPTYMLLNADGTYIWGVDTSGAIVDKTSKGTWDLTSENEIKIMPDDKTADISYYVNIGNNKYKYEFVDKDGVKTKVRMLEMDWYMEKMVK